MRDDLIASSHKPLILSSPGKKKRHSAKTQISCGSSFCLHDLCGYVQGCQGAMAEIFPYIAEKEKEERTSKKI